MTRVRLSKSSDKEAVLKRMITNVEAIPPHFSLIVRSIMTREESKVIVMIALGSLFFWRQRDQENPFWSLFFYFPGILELQAPALKNCSYGQDWADKWARIEGEAIRETQDNANYSEFLRGISANSRINSLDLHKNSD